MKCRGCGKEIVFAINKTTGRKLPLEKVQGYEIEWKDASAGNSEAVKIERDVYISHFLTCKNANDFSASNKPQQTSFT